MALLVIVGTPKLVQVGYNALHIFENGLVPLTILLLSDVFRLSNEVIQKGYCQGNKTILECV